MPDENPTDQNPSSEPPSNETVRINIPPLADSQDAKRETVRIGPTTGGASPKKESTRILAPPPPPAIPKAFGGPAPGALPAVKPMGTAGAPSMPARSGPPPKPPTPLAAMNPPAPTMTEAPPVTVKPTAPKKETARIQVPPEPNPAIPKATVRMQQTQPLVSAPAPALTAAAPAVINEVDTVADPLIVPLSAGAFVLSLIAAVLSYLAYSA